MTLIDFVFPKLRTLKTWLDKCLKGPVSEDHSTSNMCPTTLQICMRELLSYSLISAKEIVFKNFSLIDM